MIQSNADSVVILDFETTGLTPEKWGRAIEIGAVRIQNGEIKDSFQELMNPGRKISKFIKNYTGITNGEHSVNDVSNMYVLCSEYRKFSPRRAWERAETPRIPCSHALRGNA